MLAATILALSLAAAPRAQAQAASAEPAQPPADPIFVDRTAESGLDFVHFNGMTGEHYLLEVNGSGAGLLDYDNDGDLDAYLVQGRLAGPDATVEKAIFPPPGPEPLSDRLYRNDLEAGPDGRPVPRFTDVTEEAGIAATGYGMGVAAGDYDGDGWVDLYVTNFGSNQLWRNNGDGTFSDVTAAAGVDDVRWSVPAVFFDFDGDGRLDLFVGNYVDFSFARHRTCPLATGAPDYCAPLAYQPQADRLFRNRGDGTFEDVTRASGIHAAFGNALGALSADLDGDGLADLYVANDMMPNQMWINQGGGSFRDDGLIGGSAVDEEGQPQASMGVVVGDIDADGDADLFMTHLMGETNTLYLNDGSGFFTDATRRSGLGGASLGYTAFGTAWIDYDNDGWLDLAIANGAVSKIEALVRTGDPYPLHQPDQLFRNLGGRFEEVTAEAGEAFRRSEVGRGLAMGDVDNDGDSDLLLSNNAGPARLLINEVGTGAGWLGLRLVGDAGGTAVGPLVELRRAAGPPLIRRAQADGSYASAGDPRVLVGLGAEQAEAVWIEWPGGGRQRLEEPAVRRYISLPEPAGGGGR